MTSPCVHVWASCQIRKTAGCACVGNAGNVSPHHRFQRKPPVSDPGMHHGTCVAHVPWCMSRSLIRGDGENVPSIPGACPPTILRIWQEAHCTLVSSSQYFRALWSPELAQLSPTLPMHYDSVTCNSAHCATSHNLWDCATAAATGRCDVTTETAGVACGPVPQAITPCKDTWYVH